MAELATYELDGSIATITMDDGKVNALSVEMLKAVMAALDRAEQDAAVVVHLDLPWTTARLTQRLGRIWRIGSQHSRVYEYAIAPPAAAATR